MKTHLVNENMLAAGIGFCLRILHIGIYTLTVISLTTSAYAAMIIVGISLIIRAHLKRSKFIIDPEARERLAEKKLQLQKKFGVLDYLHTKGSFAHARVKYLIEVKPFYEMTVSTVTMEIEIITAGDPISLVVKKEIPNALVSQFGPGSQFTIRYDEQNPENLVFIASFNADGSQTNFKEVYGFQ